MLTSCSEVQNSNNDTYQNVDVETFKSLIEKKEGLLLDVRTFAEVKSGRIEGALNIDYHDAAFDEKLAQLDKSKPVLVYCASGGRSGGAMSKMKDLGFSKVYNLNGGMGTWKSKGYPVK